MWFVITAFLAIIFLFIRNNQSMNGKTIQTAKIQIEISPTFTPTPTPFPLQEIKKSGLGDVIQSSLEGTSGVYGIVVKSLRTGESFYLNEDRPYLTGSLYKLWVMAVTYAQIQNSLLKEDEILSKGIKDLNTEFNIDQEVAEQTEGTITMSVSDAIKQMIVISDNYAAMLLTDKVKLKSLAGFLNEHNLSASKVGVGSSLPTVTPKDMALYFEDLSKGKYANSEYTDKMLSLLRAQRLNDKIPKYLPEEIFVAHKTGELDQYTHDVGIIYTPKHDYILVILSESEDPQGAKERISQISREVYNYFTR